MKENKKHWETVYETKTPEQVSWTQAIPKTSLAFIADCKLDKSAKIIDVGGGDSNLVDHLLALGFENITVLDISKGALERSKSRLGHNANKVHWIESDILDFSPTQPFDFWHDRAAFHFLTTQEGIARYISVAKEWVSGYMAIGTFSDMGPKKCSGLDIKQYSENDLTTIFDTGFEKIKCINENHVTPFQTIQNFTFCCFKSIVV